MEIILKDGDTIKFGERTLCLLDGRLVDIERKCVSPLEICNVICDATGVTLKQIKSDSRCMSELYPRMAVAYYLRKHTCYTTTRIGKFMNRNHASVINLCKQWCNLMDTEPYIKTLSVFIEDQFNGIGSL